MTNSAPQEKPGPLRLLYLSVLALGVPVAAIVGISAMQELTTETHVAMNAALDGEFAEANHWLISAAMQDAYPGATTLKATNGGRDRYLICADGSEGMRGFVGRTGHGKALFDLRAVKPLKITQTQTLCS